MPKQKSPPVGSDEYYEELIPFYYTRKLTLHIERRYLPPRAGWRWKLFDSGYHMVQGVDHTITYLSEQADNFLCYMKFDSERGAFLHKLLLKLPPHYVCVAFCNYYRYGSHRGSIFCVVDPKVFKSRKEMLKKYGQYILYYFDNRKNVDAIINYKLVVRRSKKQRKKRIFYSLLFNPFRKAEDVGRRYGGITGGAVRRQVRVCCNRLCDTFIGKPIIKPFEEIVYGQLKESR